MSALRPVEALRQFLMDPWWYKSWSGISSQLEEAGRWKDRKNIALFKAHLRRSQDRRFTHRGSISLSYA
jgi:hypothetical protein